MQNEYEELMGGCQCGEVRYRLTDPPLRLNVCHCSDCQKQSGSAFGMSLVVAPESFVLVRGRLKEFQTIPDSGRSKTCAFCPGCGVRIFNATSTMMSIKAGTLDNPADLEPDAHYWTKSKQHWTPLPSNVPCYEATQ